MRMTEGRRCGRKTSARARFARDYQMGEDSVDTLVWLARQAFDANERRVNGDPHPQNKDPDDKNRNAAYWGREVDQFTKRIRNLTECFGFTDVVYTGLGPTLMRGDLFVEIPR